MADFGGNQGGLGGDIGKGNCTPITYEGNRKSSWTAVEWSFAGSAVLAMVSLSAKVPLMARLGAVTGSAILAYNGYLILDEQLQPSSN